MEYKILSSTSVSALAQTVSEHLAQGWKPQGGITVDTPSGASRFYQAVVKDTEESLPTPEQEGNETPS